MTFGIEADNLVIPLTTVYTKYTRIIRAITSNSFFVGRWNPSALSSYYIDDVSVKALTLSTLFSSVSVSVADVFASAAVVVTAGTQAGLVVNLDSTGSPANFVICYHDGTNVKLEKSVAGTYTTVFSGAVTYSAGAALRVHKTGTAYQVYYNNVLVTTATISDAGIIDNVMHGLFSTYELNTFDNFEVLAVGTGGEHSALDRY